MIYPMEIFGLIVGGLAILTAIGCFIPLLLMMWGGIIDGIKEEIRDRKGKDLG